MRGMLAMIRAVLGRALVAATILVSGSSAPAFWDPVTSQCQPPALEGTAVAVDGDTLELSSAAGRRIVIRLISLEAPELFQDCRDASGPWSCGREAKAALDSLLAGQAVACTPCRHGGDGSLNAICRAGETDIGVEMLRAGMATSYAFFSNAMHSAEVEARLAGRGLWRGDWVHPQAWRSGARLGAAPCRGCLVPR